MAEVAATPWAAESAWAGIIPGGQGRRRDDGVGVWVEPVDGLSLASVIACAGQAEALRARCAEAFGVEPTLEPRVAHGSDLSVVWSGPGHWLATSRHADLQGRLQTTLGELAAISDQGASRAILRLSGAKVRDTLAKGCMVDLHPGVFRDGDAAVTLIGHLGVQLWREGDDYLVAVSRSYAGSFWSWLSSSAAEFGYAVRET